MPAHALSLQTPPIFAFPQSRESTATCLRLGSLLISLLTPLSLLSGTRSLNRHQNPLLRKPEEGLSDKAPLDRFRFRCPAFANPSAQILCHPDPRLYYNNGYARQRLLPYQSCHFQVTTAAHPSLTAILYTAAHLPLAFLTLPPAFLPAVSIQILHHRL